MVLSTSDCFVFPPINHENLQISSQFDPQQTDPPSPSHSASPSSSSLSLSSSSSFSPSDVNWVDAPPPPATLPPSGSDSQVQKSGLMSGWFFIGLHLLYSRVGRFASSFRNYATVGGSIWSFAHWAGVAAMAVWLYRKIRRRNGLRGSESRPMNRIIKEKDERIAQLLNQISQMNEVLLARHRLLTSKLAD